MFAGPEIEAGAIGALPYTVSDKLPKLPHVFTAVTEIFPETNVERTFTFIDEEPDPLAIVIPEGTVHV